MLIVDNNTCNDKGLTELDLSSFTSMNKFEVGDYSFTYVNEMKLMGLNQLVKVVIGEQCFRKATRASPNRHFYLKDCERLRELKIGHHSFSDYSVCEIENVPSLEVIEMGEMNRESLNFCCASLELKSDCERMK